MTATPTSLTTRLRAAGDALSLEAADAVTVPREPTPKMVEAGAKALRAAMDTFGGLNAWVSAVYHAALAAAPPQQAGWQGRVSDWMRHCFSQEVCADPTERAHRFFEEAAELIQATDCTAEEAHQLVDYVFARPVGEAHQEVGGVMVCLAALCAAAGLDMAEAGETELARVWTKVDAIRAKHAAKPKFSPLPGALPPTPGAAMTPDPALVEAVARGWPDPARPGVPRNPERDGLHWVGSRPWKWAAELELWCNEPFEYDPGEVAQRTYGGPVLTRNEIAAQLAEARRGAFEEGARLGLEPSTAGVDAQDVLGTMVTTLEDTLILTDHWPRQDKHAPAKRMQAEGGIQAAGFKALDAANSVLFAPMKPNLSFIIKTVEREVAMKARIAELEALIPQPAPDAREVEIIGLRRVLEAIGSAPQRVVGPDRLVAAAWSDLARAALLPNPEASDV